MITLEFYRMTFPTTGHCAPRSHTVSSVDTPSEMEEQESKGERDL